MKLSAHTFKTFWSYHSWLGVVIALLLHVMFVAGIATLFKDALSIWEEPLNHREAAYEGHLQKYLEIGVEASEVAHPRRVLLVLPEEHGSVRLQYSDPSTGDWRIGWVDPTQETFVLRRERLSDFLYHLHFLRLPFTGLLEWVAGLSAVALFSTLATGVLIQFHRLLPELTRFRPEAQARTFTSDLHKVLGMLGLPFQGLYAYSGALLIFAPLLTEVATEPFFVGEYEKASNALFGSAVGVPSPAQEPAADVLPLDKLVKLAEGREPDFHPDAIRVEHHLSRGALVRIYGTMSGGQPFADARMVLNQATGAELFAHTSREDQSSNAFYRWVTGLHYADFNGMPLRFFFVLLTLGTCATLLSGNWIWLTRRDAGARGHSFLARLTAGVGAGVILAIAGLFLLSRLIPLDIPRRILIEEAGFATLLVGCVVWAWLTSDVNSLWWKQLGLSALAFLVTPLAARQVTDAGLFGSGPRIIPVVAVDVTLLVIGAALALISALLHRWSSSRRRASRSPRHSDQQSPFGSSC